MLNDDMKMLASKENIQIKLPRPSNFLGWMENISSLTQKLPESTSDIKILSLIKNSISISNRYKHKENEEMNLVDVMIKYFNLKYVYRVKVSYFYNNDPNIIFAPEFQILIS